MSLVSNGIAFIESFMLDTCSITRDPNFQYDDVLDPVTLELIPPDEDSFEVYNGKCTFAEITKKDVEYIKAEDIVQRNYYRVLIPVSETDVKPGDIFTLIAAYNDNYLLNVPMRLSEIHGGTHKTYRHFLIEKITPDRSNQFA